MAEESRGILRNNLYDRLDEVMAGKGANTACLVKEKYGSMIKRINVLKSGALKKQVRDNQLYIVRIGNP